MNKLPAAIAAAALAAALGACAGTQRAAPQAQAQPQTPPQTREQARLGNPAPPASPSAMTGTDVDQYIADWPGPSRRAARAMLARYGAPNVISNVLLQWNDRAPFTAVKVTRDAVQHHFPAPHPGVLTQEVRMAVPVDKLEELALFDGSLIVDRTRGTVAARSDTEAGNLLALNLADEIVSGKRDAASARRVYAQTMARQLSGKSSPYTEKLQFSFRGQTASPDHPVTLPAAP